MPDPIPMHPTDRRRRLSPAAARAATIDVTALAGLALLGYGLWHVYMPAAFIAPGLFLCAAAWRAAGARPAGAVAEDEAPGAGGGTDDP